MTQEDLERVTSDHSFAGTWCKQNYATKQEQEDCIVSLGVEIYEYESGNKSFGGYWWELASFKAAIAVLVILTLLVDYNMIATSLTDPGILPARIWPYVYQKYTEEPKFDEKSFSRAPIN